MSRCTSSSPVASAIRLVYSICFDCYFNYIVENNVMAQCDYGCGREAVFVFKNGAKCCSKSANSCSAKRTKDSELKHGSFRGTQFWKISGLKKSAWNKGMKLKGDKRWNGVGLKGINTRIKNGLPIGIAYTEKAEIKRRKNISKSMRGNPKAGGLRIGSGRGKKQWYESHIAGRVYLRSSYELEYAKWLDKNEIQWKQNHVGFPYVWRKRKRLYYPDFMLVDDNCFVEIKGFETKQDKAKWKSFPHPLRIIKRKDLKALGLHVI